jgi:hypothetical protein
MSTVSKFAPVSVLIPICTQVIKITEEGHPFITCPVFSEEIAMREEVEIHISIFNENQEAKLVRCSDAISLAKLAKL